MQSWVGMELIEDLERDQSPLGEIFRPTKRKNRKIEKQLLIAKHQII